MSSTRRIVIGLLGAVIVVAGACGSPDRRGQPSGPDGRAVMRDAGCGSCHTIPGVEGADGRSAPPLTHWKSRAWIAGRLENRPGELVRWLRDPQAVDPETAMPDLDLTEAEAQAVASVLLSIR